jgi:hypothetical protein
MTQWENKAKALGILVGLPDGVSVEQYLWDLREKVRAATREAVLPSTP